LDPVEWTIQILMVSLFIPRCLHCVVPQTPVLGQLYKTQLCLMIDLDVTGVDMKVKL